MMRLPVIALGLLFAFGNVGTTGANNIVTDFVGCMADCVEGATVGDMTDAYAKCKFDYRCWAKEVGAGAVTCAIKCISEMSATDLLTLGTDDSLTAGGGTTFADSLAVGDFAKCMAMCLGSSMADVSSWFQQCGVNPICWLGKVGFKAIGCLAKCAVNGFVDNLVEETTEPAEPTPAVFSVEDFIVCMVRCLVKPLDELKAVYEECKFDLTCWVKKAGKSALQCGLKCLSTFTVDSLAIANAGDDTLASDESLAVPSLAVGDFATCMASCLGKSVSEVTSWLLQCNVNVMCWFGKVGFAAFGCVAKCATTGFVDSLADAHVDQVIGDPHVIISVKGSALPVCFDMYGSEGQMFEFFYDKRTGVAINGILTSGKKKSKDAHYLGKLTVLKDGHSIYMEPHVLKVDNGSDITWKHEQIMEPMQMSMKQKSVHILDVGFGVVASVRVNVFGALDLDITVSDELDSKSVGGLLGLANTCLESVELEDEDEAVIRLCGGRRVNAKLVLRNQRRTQCWHIPFDAMFAGRDFAPPCLFCPIEKHD